MTPVISMSSTKAKAPPKFGGAFILLYHTHMDCVCCVCVVCVLCVVREICYIHHVYTYELGGNPS